MKAKSSREPLIRIAVLQGDPLRLIGLRALLESEKDFELATVAVDDICALAQHDVVLAPEPCGANMFELIEKLKTQRPDVCVIIIGSGTSDEAVLDAISVGAKGYIHDDAAATEFSQAIRTVSRGLVWAPRRVISLLIDRCTTTARRKHMPDRITNREQQVLEMLVAGRSNKEIGLPLGIEERTVKAHVAKLMRKLGVENRIKLSVHAITHQLVPTS